MTISNIYNFISVKNDLVRLTSTQGNRAFALEAMNRLDQLHWLYIRIAEVENDCTKLDLIAEHEDRSEFHPSVLELMILTESFYYFAWRFITLVDKKNGPFPVLHGIRKKCTGIRMVRNKLLEHADKPDSGIDTPVIWFGSKRGPVLKFIANVTQDEHGEPIFLTNTKELFDEGLWINVQELLSFLQTKLEVNGSENTSQ